jgi:non-heme chloroperoxidase
MGHRLLIACATAWIAIACGGKTPPPAPPPAPAVVAPPPAPAPAVVRFQAVAVNGTTLHFRMLGDSGPPVVFVHDALGNAGSWGFQDTAFARGYRVLVYSRRYHPPNAQVSDDQVYSPKLHAEDLAALLLRLDLAPAHVVGAGYGAFTALALGRDHPSLVRSLVLAEPPITSLLSSSTAGDSVRRAVLTGSLDPARAAFTRGDSIAALRAFVDGVLGRAGSFDSLRPGVRADMARHAFELRREMLANREQYLPTVTCPELGRVTTPILLVRGQRSAPFYQLISDELARCLDTETTVVIPGVGHAMHAASPLYYNQVVLRFLAAH